MQFKTFSFTATNQRYPTLATLRAESA
jgi:hypothetical protein